MTVHILSEGRVCCTGELLPDFAAREPGAVWVSFQTEHEALKSGVDCLECVAFAALLWPEHWAERTDVRHAIVWADRLRKLSQEVTEILDWDRLVDNRED